MGLFIVFTLFAFFFILIFWTRNNSDGFKLLLDPVFVTLNMGTAALIGILLSCFVSYIVQEYNSNIHQRFETVFNYDLVSLGSSNPSATPTYMKTRIKKYDGTREGIYVKFKFKDENDGIHTEEFYIDRVSVEVDPDSKPRVMKTVKWITDKPSFWLWDYRWGYEWSLVVPNTAGIERDILEEMLVQ